MFRPRRLIASSTTGSGSPPARASRSDVRSSSTGRPMSRPNRFLPTTSSGRSPHTLPGRAEVGAEQRLAALLVGPQPPQLAGLAVPYADHLLLVEYGDADAEADED